MVFKRIISLLILSLAITSISLAQKSAQATMNVQVRVVEGNAITQQGGANYVDLSSMASGSGVSELTSMSISSIGNGQMAIEKPKLLQLFNEDGEQITVPVNYLEMITPTGNLLKVEAGWSWNEQTENAKGTYKGELVTSVAYQ